MNLGKNLEPILLEIEGCLFDFNLNQPNEPLQISDDGFRAATKIFMDCIMSKMWALQERENIPIEVRCSMAHNVGISIKELVKIYTDIDTTKMY